MHTQARTCKHAHAQTAGAQSEHTGCVPYVWLVSCEESLVNLSDWVLVNRRSSFSGFLLFTPFVFICLETREKTDRIRTRVMVEYFKFLSEEFEI